MIRNVCIALVLSALTATSLHAADPSRVITPMPKRLLFVGSSLTTHGGGVHTMFDKLCEAADEPESFIIETRFKGGADIGEHLDEGLIQRQIQNGDFDVVIMQQMPNRFVDSKRNGGRKEYAHSSARQMIDLITSSGATPVWYMTWHKEAWTWDGVVEALDSVEEVWPIPMVPVGHVWNKVLTENPSLNLREDGVHPNEAGAYMASCVFYISFTQKSPVGNSYHPSAISPADAAYLQNAAWEYMKDFVERPGAIPEMAPADTEPRNENS
jgi:hypothetical protein